MTKIGLTLYAAASLLIAAGPAAAADPKASALAIYDALIDADQGLANTFLNQDNAKAVLRKLHEAEEANHSESLLLGKYEDCANAAQDLRVSFTLAYDPDAKDLALTPLMRSWVYLVSCQKALGRHDFDHKLQRVMTEMGAP